MSSLDIRERTAYLESPYYKKIQTGDFTPFYVTVTICTILLAVILIINIVLGCCSRYSEYWNDRHTGNRWIVSLWTATPKNQPSLDYTELDPDYIPEVYKGHFPVTEYTDIEAGHQEFPAYSQPQKQQQQQQRGEFVEMQKRESDI